MRSRIPLALACLLLGSSLTSGQTTTAPGSTAPGELPAGQVVLDRAIEAMGGNEAFDAIESTTFRTTASMGTVSFTADMHTRGEDESAIIRTMDGKRTVMANINGIAWVDHPDAGLKLLDETQAAQLRNEARIHEMVRGLAQRFERIETIEVTTFGDTPCYRVRVSVPRDKTAESQTQDVLFAIDSGLLVAMEQKTMPRRPVIARFSEWKRFGDIHFFTRMTVQQKGGPEVILTINEFRINDVDPSVFAVPEKVTELAAAARTEDPEPTP